MQLYPQDDPVRGTGKLTLENSDDLEMSKKLKVSGCDTIGNINWCQSYGYHRRLHSIGWCCYCFRTTIWTMFLSRQTIQNYVDLHTLSDDPKKTWNEWEVKINGDNVVEGESCLLHSWRTNNLDHLWFPHLLCAFPPLLTLGIFASEAGMVDARDPWPYIIRLLSYTTKATSIESLRDDREGRPGSQGVVPRQGVELDRSPWVGKN